MISRRYPKRKPNSIQLGDFREFGSMVDLFPLYRGKATQNSLVSTRTATPSNGTWIGLGYETDAEGERISLGNDYFNQLIDGKAGSTIALSFNFKSISGTTGENVFCAHYCSGSNAVLMYLQSTGAITVAGRSRNADSLQSLNSTRTIRVGNTYTLIAVYDYANDLIKAYVNGEEWINSSVSFGVSSYQQGAPSEDDCIGRTATWWSSARHYGYALFDEALPEQKARQLSRNFNQLYQPISGQPVAYVAAAGRAQINPVRGPIYTRSPI